MNVSKISTFLIAFLVLCTAAYGQYTETINSNRPGQSQGAFAVGNGVLQLESGIFYGNDDHNLLNTDTDILGFDFNVRYGFWREALEVNAIVQFQSNTIAFTTGSLSDVEQADFSRLTIGAKYLFYDPYKNAEEEKPNYYSYHDNFKFKWKSLIPAVSVFLGVNYRGEENRITPPQLEGISPILLVATQNNWGRWVWVNNFIVEDFTTDFPSQTWISTMTHSFSEKWAAFGEFQLINGDLNSDQIVRLGGAYLFTKDFQIDVSGLLNFKDTPSRNQVALGLSYRFDFHGLDEIIEEKENTDDKKKDKDSSKKKKKKKKKRKDTIDFEDDGFNY